MAKFFTSFSDLGEWIRRQGSSDSAARKIISVVGKNNEQDIVETCRKIFKGDSNAEDVLYKILASYNITERSEENMPNKNSSSNLSTIKKEAQAVMRQDSLYGNLPMKVCPKLPKQTAGQQLISTYNCRHYCLDSLVLDEDPNRVYCLEAIWRRNVMDKFAREFKDKNGRWVGGYINERFQVFHDLGGNQMQLAPGEKAREPRPHQWSVERRMQEQRGEKTKSIVLNASTCEKLSKMSSNDVVYNMFSDSIEMREDGLSDEDIISKLSSHYGQPIDKTASIFYAAIGKVKKESENKTLYSYVKKEEQKKIAFQTVQPNEFIEGTTWEAVNSGKAIKTDGSSFNLESGTKAVVTGKDNNGNPIFQISYAEGNPEAINSVVTIQNPSDVFKVSAGDEIEQGTLNQETLQDTSRELGLIEDAPVKDVQIEETKNQNEIQTEYPITASSNKQNRIKSNKDNSSQCIHTKPSWDDDPVIGPLIRDAYSDTENKQ